MSEPVYEDRTCPSCGQTVRLHHGLARFFLNKWRGETWCRFCGSRYDGSDPSVVRKANAGIAFGGFYLMNAGVWGVIMLFVFAILTAPFVELHGRRIAMALGFAVGAAIGFWRADVARRRGTIVDKPPR